tara:strand:- start:112 stop:423 length:312 start_codon:yes stop_codon:yes gene_type:complete
MSIATEIADGLGELETDFPATFVWNSTTYKCLAGSERRDVAAGEWGLEQDDSLTLIVQLAQFGTGSKPAERQKITFNSRTYRIESIEKAPQDAFVIYRCTRNR